MNGCKKGDPRLVNNAGSSAAGSDGSPRETLVGLGPKGPTIVRVSRAAYNTITGDFGSLYGHDTFVVMALGARNVIATLQVPANQVLDISEVQFVTVTQMGGGYDNYPDYFFFNNLFMWFEVNRQRIWDQGSTYPPPAAVAEGPGWCTLNQNQLSSWSDTPVHLVVRPQQVVDFVYTLAAGLPVPAPRIGVKVRARWLPVHVYEDIIGETR